LRDFELVMCSEAERQIPRNLTSVLAKKMLAFFDYKPAPIKDGFRKVVAFQVKNSDIFYGTCVERQGRLTVVITDGEGYREHQLN
jgi:hypothetical protein